MKYQPNRAAGTIVPPCVTQPAAVQQPHGQWRPLNILSWAAKQAPSTWRYACPVQVRQVLHTGCMVLQAALRSRRGAATSCAPTTHAPPRQCSWLEHTEWPPRAGAQANATRLPPGGPVCTAGAYRPQLNTVTNALTAAGGTHGEAAAAQTTSKPCFSTQNQALLGHHPADWSTFTRHPKAAAAAGGEVAAAAAAPAGG